VCLKYTFSIFENNCACRKSDSVSMGLNDDKLCAYDGQPAEDPVTLLCGTVYSRKNVLRLWKKQHREMTGAKYGVRVRVRVRVRFVHRVWNASTKPLE